MAYFELSCSDDGDIAIRQVDIQRYLAELAARDAPVEFVDGLDGYVEPVYWGANMVTLIKGEIVVPKPVQVATKYEVD